MISAAGLRLGAVKYVILFVKDPLRSISFYRDTLGMQVATQTMSWVELEAGDTTGTGGTRLALHAHQDMPSTRSEVAPEVVFEVDDIQATYTALKERGVKFTQPPRKVHESFGVVGMAAQFKDPDKNTLSIYGTLRTDIRPL